MLDEAEPDAIPFVQDLRFFRSDLKHAVHVEADGGIVPVATKSVAFYTLATTVGCFITNLQQD